MDGSPLGEPPNPHGTGSVSMQSASVGIRWHAPSRAGSGPQAAAAPVLEPELEHQPEAEDEEPLIGAVLSDRYRIDARIGAGGMGLVYKATHLLIGRTLAIKVLRRRYAEQDEVAKRFALEARVASSVKHMNVVDLLDYGTTPLGSPFYVMEFLDGRSLARELVRNGPLEPARAMDIACQIARGLSAAHQAGVIHRDLKPDNVYLVAADQHGPELVKILDFGIAHVAGRKTRLTAAGAVVGTPEYMSPEQARGSDLDGRSDLYALGVVLFELLTGKVPLSAESTVGTLTKQVFELAPRLRDRDPRFAAFPSVEAALGRLLAKNRDERPATALDAARLIQTAALNDLENSEDSRSRAALDGWNHPHSHALALVPERDIVRRSTIMIGSGSVSRAHEGDADGPATGSFAAKQQEEEELRKRPSIIIRDGVPSTVRPRTLDGDSTPDSVSPITATAATRGPVSKTPTPDRNRALGKPSGRGFARRNLPLILLGVGAAIFAALVTIGFVRWLERREARTSLPTPTSETTDRRGSEWDLERGVNANLPEQRSAGSEVTISRTRWSVPG
jgi:serine/threonine protein kinase